jgi:hypothetical protein
MHAHSEDLLSQGVHVTAGKKVLTGTLIVTLLVAVIGYGLAFSAKKDCVKDTSRDLFTRHVKGFTMEGPVDTSAIPITARVAWPFVVDVDYKVPWGMHVAMARNRYTVFPWGANRISHTVELPL